jgi:hypothetical protein
MSTFGRFFPVLVLAVTLGCGGASETNRNLVKLRVTAGLDAETERLDAAGRLHAQLAETLASAQAQPGSRGVPGANEVTEQLDTLTKEMDGIRKRILPRRQELEVFVRKMPQKKLEELDTRMAAEHTSNQAVVEALFGKLEAVRGSLNAAVSAAGAQATDIEQAASDQSRERSEAAREAQAAPRREKLKHQAPHSD